MLNKYSLLIKFALFSILSFILTGIVLTIVITGHIKADKLENVEAITRYTVKYIVQDNYEYLLDQKTSYLQEEKIKSQIQENLPEFEIFSIAFIDRDYQILLATDLSYWEKHALEDELLANVLQGNGQGALSESVVQATDTSSSSVSQHVYNIYEPLYKDGQIKAVFIVQLCAEEVEAHTKMIAEVIILALFGGLLILILFLAGLFFKISRKLFNQNQELIEQKAIVENSYQKLSSSYAGTVFALSNAVDAKDHYTAGHSSRVTKISTRIGNALKISEKDLQILENAARLHDIGKVGISDQILNKNGKLTEAEFSIMKRHPEIGVMILDNVSFLQKSLPYIRHHHERIDGGGYPGGLENENIPQGARIIAIADAYDAMTSDRPYRPALSHDQALKEMINCRGSQFDADLLDVFLSIADEFRNIHGYT